MLMQHAASDAPASAESTLDRQMEDLISRIVEGVATESELQKYNDLARERVRLMHPEAIVRVRHMQNLRKRTQG